MDKPTPGLVTEANFVRVVDGDTIEVEIRRRFKVRVKDFLAEESNKQAGADAKDFAEKTFKKDEKLTIWIPSNNPLKLVDFTSFDRIVGSIWFENGENYADFMTFMGKGRYLKQGEKGHEGL